MKQFSHTKKSDTPRQTRITKLFAKISVGVFIFLLTGCLTKIEFNVPAAQSQIVVDGFVSDQPGPYTLTISEAIDLNADSIVRVPVEHASIRLMDDQGANENYIEVAPGDYSTGGTIKGQIGRSYHISIVLPDGRIFESLPDLLKPVGSIDDIRFEFEARTTEEKFGIVKSDVFKIFADAKNASGDDNYARWRFKATYKVFTYPRLHFVWSEGFQLKDPYPCSGYVIGGGPFGSGGILEQVGPCTCCTCWAKQFESIPNLSDAQLVSGNQFNNIRLGEIPITSATFYDKVLVEVDQMSMSRQTFDFFRLIRAQKQGTSSLFQPPSGEINGNVTGASPVVGIFWATSINSKHIFIRRSDVPYPVLAIPQIVYPCTWYPNATNVQPLLWE